jgi:hypothetical protein
LRPAFLLIVLFLCGGLSSTAWATDPVTVKPVPAKLELSADEATSLTVLVANTSTSRVSDLRLEPITNGAARVTVQPKGALALGGGQTRKYELSIGPWSSPRPPASLSLLATFTAADAAGTTSTRQAAIASVELAAPAPVEIEKLAGVEVKASLETLRSGQTEPVYLLVSNKSAQRLKVKEVISSHPDFIEIEDLSRNVTIGPGQVGLLELEAKAEDEVKPGEHQLVFRLPSEIGGTAFDLVATQKTKVGVAGEAEVLTILGIPSLLILPGFLVLATISLLWRILRPSWVPKEFPLTLKEPEFWVVAVLASIAIVLLANPIGNIDLLGQYGLTDLIELWLASMGVGLFLYLAILGAWRGWRSLRIPTGDDDPVKILRKLGRRKLDIKRPKFSYDPGSGNSIDLFLIEPRSDTGTMAWACPAITFTWSGNVDPNLNEEINQELDTGHDAKILAGHLSKGIKEGKLTVSFEGGRSPIEIEKGKVGVATPDVMGEAV